MRGFSPLLHGSPQYMCSEDSFEHDTYTHKGWIDSGTKGNYTDNLGIQRALIYRGHLGLL
jgi:hypothetical protein